MTSEKVKLVLEVSPEEADLINFFLKIGKNNPSPLINDTQRIEDTDVVSHNPKHERSEIEAAPVSFDRQSLTQVDFTASISDADALTEMVTTLAVEGEGGLDIPSIRFEESHPATTENSRDNHVERSLSPPPRIPSPDWSKEEEEFIDIAEKTVRASAYQSSDMSATANKKEEDRHSPPPLSLASLPQHRAFDSTTSHKQAQPPQPQSQLIPSGRGISEYKGSDVYAGIQHYPPPQPQPRVFKVVKEIRHPDNAGHQPILNNGWTDNTPSADFTRKGFSSSSSTSSIYPSKSSGYSTSHSRYHDSEAASDGWVATPLRPVSDDHEGDGQGRGGNGGGNKRDFADRPSASHHSSSSSSTTGQWSWSDKGGWVPFDSKTNYALEAAYQNGHPHEKYFAGGNYYCVDFKEMKQYRLTGHGSRDMRKFRAVQRVPTSRWDKFKESMPKFF